MDTSPSRYVNQKNSDIMLYITIPHDYCKGYYTLNSAWFHSGGRGFAHTYTGKGRNLEEIGPYNFGELVDFYETRVSQFIHPIPKL